MYRIVKKRILNPTVTMMDIEAPIVARKAEPGQFIILRVDENGERIPLTIAAYDREKGTVTIIFQIVGATTEKLNHKNEGDTIADFVADLRAPTPSAAASTSSPRTRPTAASSTPRPEAATTPSARRHS